MSIFIRAALLPCIAVAGIGLAGAQSQGGAPGLRPDPADAAAAVPPAVYQSGFRNYRALGEDSLVPWRTANDDVARRGGWRAYAKEAQQPEATGTAAPPKAAAAPVVAPAAGTAAVPDQGGHRGHPAK